MTYQKVTGPLMANSHPGSYCGQDAYSDMLITGGINVDHGNRTSECRDNVGGCPTLNTMHEQPIYIGTEKEERPMAAKSIVRRLTPLECERLQGFPDNYTLIGEPRLIDVPDYTEVFDPTLYEEPNPVDYGIDPEVMASFTETDEEDITDDRYLQWSAAKEKAISKAFKRVKVGSHKETAYFYRDSSGKEKRCTDSERYKALGNSIALPYWKVLLKRISAQYDRDATMASLFDGIGGFPLLWEQFNGKGSALWASEIEEFPMAVTKIRLGD